MAKTLTILERRKRNRRLAIIVATVISLTAIVLFMGLGKESGEGSISEFSNNETILMIAEVVNRDVFIPESFFNDELLANFKEYVPIPAPASWGRDDPFIPF